MPVRSNCPSRLLSFVRARSPSYTWMVTAGWLSLYVLNVCRSKTKRQQELYRKSHPQAAQQSCTQYPDYLPYKVSSVSAASFFGGLASSALEKAGMNDRVRSAHVVDATERDDIFPGINRVAGQLSLKGEAPLSRIEHHIHDEVRRLTSSFLAGTVVLRGMRVVMIPPAVSIPRLRGATSSSSRSWTFSDVSPFRMAAYRSAAAISLLASSCEHKRSRL